jgi:hypothetical protein
MSKFKEIERRFDVGYAPSVYGTVANARLQMHNDLEYLITEFKKLTIPNVSSSFSIEFAQYIAENHYKLVNVENGKYYWKNETHLKTSQQLMKTFKDTIGFK